MDLPVSANRTFLHSTHPLKVAAHEAAAPEFGVGRLLQDHGAGIARVRVTGPTNFKYISSFRARAATNRSPD
jgi:hypothetical protein